MISEPLVYAVDLAADTTHQTIKQPLVRGDKKAHTITLVVLDSGGPADLTGCTASVVVVRPDQATVTCTGRISGHTVMAELENACYLYAGEAQIYCRISTADGIYTRTILWLTGTVVTADTDTIVTDTTTTLPSIDEFNAVLTQCQSAASAAQSAAGAVAAYPYQQVQGYATNAQQSAEAAARSAAEAAASSGIPDGGNDGDLLMRSGKGAEWSDVMTGIQQDIADAQKTFEIRTVTVAAADAPQPAAHQTVAGSTVQVSVEDGAVVIPIAGRPATSVTFAIFVSAMVATVDGTVATIVYDVTNGSASSVAKRDWVLTYLVIY